jgi:BirA family biotin operon repressor/biotin-[acetyl-CoA-carboxylase] ligase
MNNLAIINPFGAPVDHLETTSSPMTDSRLLAGKGESHGTVVCADFQETGRGRGGRSWRADKGKNLFFTILLRFGGFASTPPALTLRTGLALALAIDDFAPALGGKVRIKWPNDIMIGLGKAAGILAESDGRAVYIGVGVNLAQTEFPEELRGKATSIALALRTLGGGEGSSGRDTVSDAAARDLERALAPGAPHRLLERFLARFYAELEPPPAVPPSGTVGWRQRLEERLYMKGRPVRFVPGGPDSGRVVEGVLSGIGPEGELLLTPQGKAQTGAQAETQAYAAGELQIYAGQGSCSGLVPVRFPR